MHCCAALDTADHRHGARRRHRADRPQGQGADPAAPRRDRLRVPVLQPGADADRARRTSCCRCPSPAASPTRTWYDTVIDTVDLARPARPPAQRALRRPAAAGRRRPGAGQPARDRLRRRADRQPRLPLRCRGARRCCAAAVDEFGQTVVMVTHDPVAAAYTDRVRLPRRRPGGRRAARPGPRPGAGADDPDGLPAAVAEGTWPAQDLRPAPAASARDEAMV